MSVYLVLSVLGAVAPAAFFLHFIYVRDKYEREPLGLLLRVYFLSFFTVLPALVLEIAGGLAMEALTVPAVLGAAIVSFAIVGLAEEGSKLLFLRRLAFKQAEFDEPYDGILYGVAVGLGFATVENIGYVLAAPTVELRLQTIVARAVLSVPVHTLLGVIMGAYLGRAKFATAETRGRLLWLALLLPTFAHGLYNFPLITMETGAVGAPLFWVGISVLTVVVLWVVGFRLIRAAQETSPFKRPNPLVHPLAAFNMAHKFCTQCGTRTERAAAQCRVCGAGWREPHRTGG